MITEREFVQRVIRKLMDYRSMIGVKIFYEYLHDDYLVVGAVPKDKRIYLRGPRETRPIFLTHDHFIGQKYDEIMQKFIVITTIRYMEMVINGRK